MGYLLMESLLLKAVRALNMRLTILANAKRGTQQPILRNAIRFYQGSVLMKIELFVRVKN
jgi:hypothetical protein